MQENPRPEDSDSFIVPLQGRPVACTSLGDAAAIRIAEGILADGYEHFVLPEELDRLIGVIVRYGRTDVAETLAQLASRMRAAQRDQRVS